VLHALRLGAILVVLAVAILLPYLPGEYDGLAQTVSVTAQLIGVVGLLLVPIGALWLAAEVLARARSQHNRSQAGWRFGFAIAALIGCSLLVLASMWVTLGFESLSFGLVLLGVWLYAVWRLIPATSRLNQSESTSFNVTPVYLVSIPLAVLLLQLLLAAPATDSSRGRAIAAGAGLIADIERYRRTNGAYPRTLAAINRDYQASTIGIEGYTYAPNADSYDLSFQQPRFLLDDFGVREVVVFNPVDQHIIMSHAAGHLVWTPDVARTRQGWFAAYETGVPHWKSFWFD
jgi:MFS family permease